MALLDIVSNAFDETGFPTPTTVIGSMDQSVIIARALANREGKELAKRGRWSVLTKQTTHTTLAAELQGALSTIAPGFEYLIGNTMWNRTSDRPINGGLYPADFQQMQAYGFSSPYPMFYIRQGNLYFYPAPTAGDTIAFEYMDNRWCSDSTGATLQSAWAADTDIGVLDEGLMTMGLKWRFLRSRGMDYEQEFQSYEKQVQDALARDASRMPIRFGRSAIKKGWTDPSVPCGNWQIY